MQPVAFDDIARDFLDRCEPVGELTVAGAWRALLANAELPMVRKRTPHRADDYVGFEVRPGGGEGLVLVTVERRIAMISELGDYEGTRVLRCDLRVVADAEPWIADGHVTVYEQLDGVDRPPLAEFCAAVEASAAFAATRTADVVQAGAASGWQ